MESTRLPIVGIGASAGGLGAIKSFFEQVPANPSMAFIIIQHLSPKHKSATAEILSKHTSLPIHEAQDGQAIEINTIYVIPKDKNLSVKKDQLILSNRYEKLNLPIDHLFKSLAHMNREDAIGVILSGTGSDGSEGAKDLKEKGGLLIVQDPRTAEFDGMPMAAIETGLVDEMLPPSEIYPMIAETLLSPPIKANEDGDDEDEISVNFRITVLKIINLLKKSQKIDFTEYKPNTIYRRLLRRMEITGHSEVENYFLELQKNEEEQSTLIQEFLIGVTNFFRDKAAFEVLQNLVLPELLSSKSNGETIKVWICACSTGEEAYSIAILLMEAIQAAGIKLEIKVIATDINPRSIAIARNGVYSTEAAEHIPHEYLDAYFEKENDQYIVKRFLRNNVVFCQHDITKDPPFNSVDLITCRNMLIYHQPSLQRKVLGVLRFALRLNGYLFLGKDESINSMKKIFRLVDSRNKIYQNIDPVKHLSNRKPNRFPTFHPRKSHIDIKEPLVANRTFEKICKVLIRQNNMVCILVKENLDVVDAFGNYKKFLDLPSDRLVLNLLKILPTEQSVVLSMMIRNAEQSGEAQIKSMNFKSDDQIVLVDAFVEELAVDKDGKERGYVITLCEKATSPVKEIHPEPLATNDQIAFRRIQELEAELGETKATLRDVIEQLENSNEELQSTNEELMSSNEELQSSNEELMSVNEELHTVNAEFQLKNNELSETSNDIEHLMKSTNIATLFLDDQLNVRRFTPKIKEHYNLMPQDVGRPFNAFSDPFEVIQNAQQVLNTLETVEKEVLSQNGWHLISILPMLSETGESEGVVVTFFDITDRKSSELHVKESEEKHRRLIEQGSTLTWVADAKGNLLTENDSWNTYTGQSFDEYKNFGWADAIHPDDRPELLEVWDICVREKSFFHAKARLFNQQENRYRHFLANAVPFLNVDGSIKSWFGAIVDVHGIKEYEEALADSENRFKLAIDGTNDGIWDWPDIRNDELWLSEKFYLLLGYEKGDFEATMTVFRDLLIHPEDRRMSVSADNQCINDGEPVDIECRLKTKSGDYKWFRRRGKASLNGEGTPYRMSGSITDIDQHKRDQVALENTQHFLEKVTNVVPGTMYVFNQELMSNEFANNYLANSLGYTSQEIREMEDQMIAKLAHPDDVPVILDHFNKIKALNDGEVCRSEYRMQHKNGSYKWLLSVDTVFERSKDGKVLKHIGIATDITSIKEIQANLSRTNEDLEQFTYIATHDLKTPIANIEGFLSLLKNSKDKSEEKVNDVVHWLDKCVDQAKATINNLLEVAKTNSEKNLPIDKCNFKTLLQETVDSHHPVIESTGAQIKSNFRGCSDIWYFKSHLRSILYNLVSNAIKYRDLKRTPKILVKTQVSNEYVILTIKDNGVGIDLERDRDKVFGLFKRAHTVGEGSGMALYMIKKKLERDGGGIEVQSQLGIGSTFIVRLRKREKPVKQQENENIEQSLVSG